MKILVRAIVVLSLVQPCFADLPVDGQGLQGTLLNKPIINNTDRNFEVVWDKQGMPVITQNYALDSSLRLTYFLKSDALGQGSYRFPQDFLLEVPRAFMTQHPAKRLDQITVLGSHNCFSNRAEGFLYFQQGASSESQFVSGGARMLRPAWHNPSGSFIDRPNNEPILCHSDDIKCATVSLATRGFRPHRLVKELNKTFVDLLQRYPDQFLIVGINNSLLNAQTDAEIEKIAGLKDMVITPADLASKVNQEEWNGLWPTVAWMLKHNKRIIFFNDDTSKYTLSYKEYITRNRYGTADVATAAALRSGESVLPGSLVELSWFQDISLDPADRRALEAGVNFYQNMRQQLDKLTSGGSWFFSSSGYLLKKVGFPVHYFENSLSFSHISDAISFTLGKFKFLGSFGPFKYIFESISGYQSSFNQAVKDIVNYIPAPQDNSLNALFTLCQACRKSGILQLGQNPNIIMLDFSTTEGDGILAINIFNVLMDQRLGLQFVGLGGFAVQGKEVVVPADMVQLPTKNRFVA